MAWTPVLRGDAANRARDAIRAIATALRDPDPSWRVDASLANGDAGLAVLYGYLAIAEPEGGHDDIAQRCLERAIDAMARDPMAPSLHHGFVGVAWATEHLTGHLLEPGDDDPGAVIDQVLLDHLRGDGWTRDHDLMSGIVGIGGYALERLPRPGARALLELVVARLGELAERRPEGLAWRTPPHVFDASVRARFPEGAFNLGLAHGVPGVIGLLAACVAAGVAVAESRALLEPAITWLVACALPDGTFPDLVAPGVTGVPSRVAWCYGDLAVATALLAAGRVLDRADLRVRAVALARDAATRSAEGAGVRDACLCHGAAGLGLMYLRLARAADDRVLEAAATRWFEDALARRAGDQVAGFAPFVVGPELALGEAAVGVVTGAAGVALALLAATTHHEPSWDRFMLLSQKTPDRVSHDVGVAAPR